MNAVTTKMANIQKVLLFLVLCITVAVGDASKVFNVDEFGAKGDGKIDNKKAFLNAWEQACSSPDPYVVFQVPYGKTYMISHVIFKGPCKGHLVVEINGKLLAPSNKWDVNEWEAWIQFENHKSLEIRGSGTVDGNGEKWWKCKISKKCSRAPAAMKIKFAKDIRVQGLKFKDSQERHISVYACVNAVFDNLDINAPEKSPNTDGIQISHTRNVLIRNSNISTGDDCISIIGESSNIFIKEVHCGPGHGISIGSLGKYSVEDHVKNVFVDKAYIKGTTNGVRIKTWQGGNGLAYNLTFQRIEMKDVANPIIIDQFYCDKKGRGTCEKKKKAVQVKKVIYKDISGTCSTRNAVSLNCSASYPCQDILFQDVNLAYSPSSSKKPNHDTIISSKSGFSCSNANIHTLGHVSPYAPCN